MKLHSKALDKDYDFVTFEKEDDIGRKIKVIMHDSLRDVILNQCEGVQYSNEIVCADANHSVVVCKMWNEKRCVTEFGESTPDTLTNDIARQYPTLIATQRAFDRAAIAFLNLPGKVLSNMEIDIIDDIAFDVSVEDAVKVETKDIPIDEISAPSGIVSSVVSEETETTSDTNIDIEEISDDSKPVVDDLDINNDIVVVSDEEELPFTADDEEDNGGNHVVTMKGKYQTAGLSVSEIYNKDASWVEWIAAHFVPQNDIAKKDVAEIKKFVASIKK